MKKILACTFVVLALSCVAGRPTKDAADAALTATQLACVFSSSITDDAAVAKACGLADALLPLLHDLIGQREGARKASVSWGPKDAGSDASPPKDAGAADARLEASSTNDR